MSNTMLSSSASKARLAGAFAVAFLGAALLGPNVGYAAGSGPFGAFPGNWRGTGQVVSAGGQTDTIACRATYTTSERGDSLKQSLVCASDSYRFDISSEVVANGNTFQRQWQEADRNLLGNLTGQISRGDYQGMVTGQGFTAQIAIKVSERKQVVSIRPSAGSITDVEVALTRQH